MSSKSQLTIRQAIQKLAGTQKAFLFDATVQSVKDYACVVYVDYLGFEVPDVQLQAAGGTSGYVRTVPKVGSQVVVAATADEQMYVIMCSEVESVEIGGNKFGLLNSEDLIAQLNKTNAAVQALLDAIRNNATYTAGDGGASMNGALKTAMVGQEVGSFDGLINKTVTHGN